MRQRCAWCGELLIDYDLTRVSMLVEGDEDPTPATWPAGKFIEVDPPMTSVLEWEGEKLPPHACMRMPVEETR